MSSAAGEFVHASQIIQSRKADIFVWWPSTPVAEMMGCINSSLTGPVTAGTMLRWVNIVGRLGGTEVMEVRRAAVRLIAVLQYWPEPKDPVPKSSVLTPGDYGCYYTVPGFLARARPLNPSYAFIGKTLADRKCDLEYQLSIHPGPHSGPREALERYIVPEPFREQVTNRDGRRCIFTGPVPVEAEGPDVFWIFPPGMFRYTTTQCTDRYMYDASDFQVTENLVTMRRDIYELWHSNAFCVDVDDDFRICIFDEKAKDIGLPRNLRNIPAGEKSNLFFEQHMKSTLVANFMGGDIEWDYDDYSVQELMEDLGLSARPRPEEGQSIDVLDERLQSGIGKAILEHYMSQRFRDASESLYEDEESDDRCSEGS
ncbi:hypothetical protein C8Q72DRAFT_157841 [Fomitopsis betulina]|nr:hypothetical protein C8Q72DRAFT_157841 [Fomitopsis betulina]